MAASTYEVVWIMQLLLDLHISIPHVHVFHCDN